MPTIRRYSGTAAKRDGGIAARRHNDTLPPQPAAWLLVSDFKCRTEIYQAFKPANQDANDCTVYQSSLNSPDSGSG